MSIEQSTLNEVDDILTFACEFIDPLLVSEKRLTARIAFDREYEPDDTLALATPGGHVFAIAKVEDVREMSAEAFVEANFNGHQTYENDREFLEILGEYYPDAVLTSATKLTVIFLRNVVDAGPRPEASR